MLGSRFFCGLVAKVLQIGTTSGHFCSLYYSKDGKLKTSVSLIPNTTFSSFEGLGRNILGNFLQHFFWYGFWVMILLFFCEIGGPAGVQSDFLVIILRSYFTLIFD